MKPILLILFKVFLLSASLACQAKTKKPTELPAGKAPSCTDSVHHALKNSEGSMGDVSLYQAAMDICSVPESKLSKKDKKLKESMGQRCLQQYPASQGSLARSQNALCHLLVEQYWFELQ